MNKLVIFSVLVLAFFVSGCIYKPSVQQGNILEQKEVDKIKPGMTKEQIAFVLGKPVLDTDLDSNTWYYLYYMIPSKGEKRTDRLILNFDGDTLQSLEGTIKPGDEADPEQTLSDFEDSK